MEGATLGTVHRTTTAYISIYAPAEGATARYAAVWKSGAYFNPRSREESNPFRSIFQSALREGSDVNVTVYGATIFRREYYNCGSISTRAPAEGATI